MLQLFQYLTLPDNIIVKKLGGKAMTCKDLCRQMEVIASLLESGESFKDVKSLILVRMCGRAKNTKKKLFLPVKLLINAKMDFC